MKKFTLGVLASSLLFSACSNVKPVSTQATLSTQSAAQGEVDAQQLSRVAEVQLFNATSTDLKLTQPSSTEIKAGASASLTFARGATLEGSVGETKVSYDKGIPARDSFAFVYQDGNNAQVMWAARHSAMGHSGNAMVQFFNLTNKSVVLGHERADGSIAEMNTMRAYSGGVQSMVGAGSKMKVVFLDGKGGKVIAKQEVSNTDGRTKAVVLYANQQVSVISSTESASTRPVRPDNEQAQPTIRAIRTEVRGMSGALFEVRHAKEAKIGMLVDGKEVALCANSEGTDDEKAAITTPCFIQAGTHPVAHLHLMLGRDAKEYKVVVSVGDLKKQFTVQVR